MADNIITGNQSPVGNLVGTLAAYKYVLPTASADTLGGIKVGANLTIDADGRLSAAAEIKAITNTSQLINDSGFVINSNLAKVATSGKYSDLTGLPTIPIVPTKLSAFTNDADFITSTTVNNTYAKKTDIPVIPTLATVATTGAYSDLTGLPTIPTVPTLSKVATSGKYSDLTGLPTIPTAVTKTSQLTNDSGYATTASLATVATTGSYNNLTDTPVLPTLATVATSGKYSDLIGLPTIPISVTKTSQLINDSKYVISTDLKTVATSGKYSDLSGLPTIPVVPTKTSDLVNDSGYIKNTTLATVATTGSYNDLADKPTISTLPTLATVATSGNYADLTNKPTIPAAVTKISQLINDSDFAATSYVDSKIAAVINTAPETLDTLNELAAALGNDPNFATTMTTALGSKANTADLAKVATSGNYNDLTNKPTIPVLPTLATVATSGKYSDLTGLPTTITKTSQLTNDSNFVASTTLKTVATTGSYNDLSDKPTIPTVPTLATVATSGKYSDLTGIPTVPSKTSQLTNDSQFVVSTALAAVATSGSYVDLSNKPTIPTVPTAVSAFTNDANYITAASDISGNAATATLAAKATADAAGNVIVDTYATKASVPNIQVVTAMPATPVEGVIYLVQGS